MKKCLPIIFATFLTVSALTGCAGRNPSSEQNNAALASTPDELTEFLAAVADVSGTISFDDENYDFLDTTIRFSSQELYCEHMGE